MFCCKLSLCVLLSLLLMSNVYATEKAKENKTVFIGKSDDSFSKNLTQNTLETLKVLTQKPIKSTAGEADDLLHGGEFKNITHHEKEEQHLISYSEDPSRFKNNGKWDIELIEDGSNTEDDRIKHIPRTAYDSPNSETNYDLVTILVLSVTVIVLAGYGTYYVWRKFNIRHKKRQVLVNEVDPDDIRYFSL